MKALGTIFLALWASVAAAQEFIVAEGALEDEAFYRLIACAAPPGRPCQRDFMRWPEGKRENLRVGITSATDELANYQVRLYEQALQATVDQVNGLGAGIQLALTSPPHDVELHIVQTAPGDIMRDTGVPLLDGFELPLGRVAVRARDGDIVQAVIAISYQARRRTIASIVLEELVQGLGLMTDIRSPAYPRSIFSEDSNSGTRLTGQDAMVLRRHYPPS